MTWLVLCDEQDAAAHWAAERLVAHGLAPLETLTSRELADEVRVIYRGNRKGARVTLRWASGRELGSETVRGALNRLHGGYHGVIQRFVEEDRAYVAQEYLSGLVGWLSALSRNLLNPPTTLGVAGRWRSPSEWFWLAGRAGLPVPPHRERHVLGSEEPVVPAAPATSARAFVVGDRVVGELPPTIVDGCRRLGRLAETPLLGVDLAPSEDGHWWFSGASPVPDLRQGGEALVSMLAQALRGAA
jgi:hypothetical protein